MTKPTPKRWFRFSLRTLMVVMAVVCVLLGWKMNQVNRQRQTVETILQDAGYVVYDYQLDENGRTVQNAQAPGPVWFRRIAGDDFFAHVVSTETLADPSLLRNLPHLKNLEFYSPTEVDLTPLAELKELVKLELTAPVSDLTPLADLSALKLLVLDRTQVTDLSPLVSLSKLSQLMIRQSPVSDEEVERLQRALPNLKIIR